MHEGIKFTKHKKTAILKFLIYLYYFFRSVFLRGLFNTVKLLRTEITQEKKFNIKTSSIKKSASKEFFHYQGAPYWVLINLLSNVYKHTMGFIFVDIGSGKGRALFVAEHIGYEKLIGIELDEELIQEANNNLKSYAFKKPDSTISFIKANALEFDYENAPCVYFLFNPFNETTMQRVLDRIVKSTRNETWFVYMNPLFLKVFENDNFILVKEFKTRRYLEAVVYKVKATLLH